MPEALAEPRQSRARTLPEPPLGGWLPRAGMVRALQALSAMQHCPAAWFAMALGAAMAATTNPARAEANGVDRAAAQALFDQAKALLAEGKVAEACPKLEESQHLDPASGTLINLADCYERQGKVASAWSTFVQAAAASKAGNHLEREQVARERASTLAPRLSKLVIQVTAPDVPGLEVKRDGASVGKGQWGAPIPADLGSHRIVASAPGRREWETVVTIRSEAETVAVLVPAPVIDPSSETPRGATGLGTQRALALAAGGVGVAGIAFGTAFGIVSRSKRDEAELHCSGPTCRDATGVDLRNEAVRAGNVSTVGFLVGAAALAGGVVLWLTANDAPTMGLHPSVRVGLGQVELGATW